MNFSAHAQPVQIAPTPPTAPAIALGTPIVAFPIAPAVQSITVELRPAEKANGWLDPAAIIPALAIVGTLVATMVQLSFGRKNLERQLSEAKMAARAEREHSFQKEVETRLAEARTKVFTELIEAFKKALLLIGGLGALNPIKEKELSLPIANLTASANKVWLFASTETVLQTRELLAKTTETFFDGMAECMPIYKNLNLLQKIEEATFSLLQDEKDAFLRLQEFKHAEHLSTEAPAALVAREKKMIESLNRAVESVSKCRADRQLVLDNNFVLLKHYAGWLIPRQVDLMNCLSTVLKLARVELKVPGEMERIDIQTVDLLRRLQQAIEKITAL